MHKKGQGVQPILHQFRRMRKFLSTFDEQNFNILHICNMQDSMSIMIDIHNLGKKIVHT